MVLHGYSSIKPRIEISCHLFLVTNSTNNAAIMTLLCRMELFCIKYHYLNLRMPQHTREGVSIRISIPY